MPLPTLRFSLTSLALLTFSLATGCNNNPPPKAADTHTAKDGHDHAHAEGDGHDHDHDHAHAEGENHDHSKLIDLGSSTIGSFTAAATRDQGEIKAGGEAPIDVTITGDLKSITAVRFWIGTQDAAGSIKAKAEVENPAEPGRFHTHVEAPSPLPAIAELWVEIESADGKTTTGSFPLKLTGS